MTVSIRKSNVDHGYLDRVRKAALAFLVLCLWRLSLRMPGLGLSALLGKKPSTLQKSSGILS